MKALHLFVMGIVKSVMLLIFSIIMFFGYLFAYDKTRKALGKHGGFLGTVSWLWKD